MMVPRELSVLTCQCHPGRLLSFHLAPQNDQLLPERRILSLKPALRLERRHQDGQHKADQRDHCANLADFVTSSMRMRVSARTPLPSVASCATIARMAKRQRPLESTPDLFTTAPQRELRIDRAPVPSESPTARQCILPKDLSSALMRLTEDELNTLTRTVNEELARRNMRIQPGPTSGQEKEPKQTLASVGKKTNKRAAPETNALPLTQSRINAIRAAFKAGVKPSTIARQFGVSRSAIQQALSDKADR